MRREAWELGEEDYGSEEIKERFDRLEKGLWEEVDNLSRFVSAESDEPPPKRQVFQLNDWILESGEGVYTVLYEATF